MGIQVVKVHLFAINQGSIGLSERLPIFLERIFELYALDKGITWSYRPMLLKENNSETDWGPVKVEKFKWVEHNTTPFQNMVENVLYYLDNKSFPLVDMYYKNKFGLVGIQATMGTEHAKNVSVYKKFYDKIGTKSKCDEFEAVLPDHASQYWSLQGERISTDSILERCQIRRLVTMEEQNNFLCTPSTF